MPANVVEDKGIVRKSIRWALGLAALAVASAACVQNAPQDSLKPAGPYADEISNLFKPVFWIAAAIFFIVEGTLLVFVIRYRHRKGRQEIPPQVHGNTRLEIGWTILPALILVGVAVPTVSTIYSLAQDPGPTALNVSVIGHQWWWEFDYTAEEIITANELHIPTGRPVYVHLCAVGLGYDNKPTPSECQDTPAAVGDSVIHSFWVPKLAGKQDVVPGRTNTLVLQADHPGVYSGQCAEFCGLSHAYMRFRVIAQTPDDFAAWVLAQQRDAVTPAEGSLAASGLSEFNGVCIACHAIQGVEGAVANGGPNLTHFATRGCFAGCIFENTTGNLEKWLRDPPAVKPGSWMPNYHLTDEQIRALVAYLQSLT